MADHPYMPLWSDAYLADTQHLTITESGVYLHLLMCAWRSPDCSLPDDDRKLSRMVKTDLRTWKNRLREAVLIEFFQLNSDGRWVQLRLLKERKHVDYVSRIRAASRENKSLKNNETTLRNGTTKQQQKTVPTLKDTTNVVSPPIIPPKNQTAKPSPKARGRPKKTPSRIPADFTPNQSVKDHARKRGFDGQEFEFEIDQFRDYWLAKRDDDRNARKSDWQAAARSWFNNARKYADERANEARRREADAKRSGSGGLAAAIAAELDRDASNGNQVHEPWGGLPDQGLPDFDPNADIARTAQTIRDLLGGDRRNDETVNGERYH